MSLQIWLPLNGNLKNNGCDGGTVSSVNASTSTSGKIGSCYSFNGSSSYLLGTHSFLSNSTPDWSFACWMKLNSTSAGQCLFSCRTIVDQKGIAVFYYGSTWLIDDGVRWQFTPTVTIVANKWYHVCVVHKKDVGKYLYINGSLDSSTTTTSTPTVASTTNFTIGNSQTSSTAASGNPLNGYLNDVRIYDHALSVAEVKELAKGLVCHYKLDDYKGLPNLVSNSKTFSGWSAASGWTQVTTDNGSVGYRFTRTGATSNNWVRLIPTLKINGNDYPNGITVSLDLLTPSKADINQKCIGSIQTYQESGSRIGWAEPGWDLTNVIDGKWSRVSYAFSQTLLLRNNTSGTTYSYTQFSFQLVQNGDITIRNIKIEDGDVSTLYIPNSSDAEYKALGYDSTTITDCSGNGYDGTLSGTLTASTDTARYGLSTNFNKSGYIINGSLGLTTTAFTVNIWVKPRTTSSQHFLFGTFSTWPNNGIGIYRDSGSNKYQCVIRSAGESTYSGKSITTTLNVWNMITVTYSGTVYTGYLNGAKSFEVTYGSSGNVTHPNIMVGNSKYNSTPASENEEALISDVRLYATCLSADDVKRLYNTAASVSKNGSLLGYEFNEVT